MEQHPPDHPGVAHESHAAHGFSGAHETHESHETNGAHGPRAAQAAHGSLNRVALSATIHCLTGCSIGEVLGMVIGTALGMGTWSTIALAVVLAFFFGYLLTMLPLLRAGIGMRQALGLALAADTASITIMEIVDNAVMLLIPGAMDAGLTEFKFWGSLALALLIAGMAAYPVVRWLIARGRGHAVVHPFHGREVDPDGVHH